MQILKIENAHKSYGDKILLEEVSFTVNAGHKIALVAKNGSGKSTLLKIISGKTSVEGENALLELNQQIKTSILWQQPDLNGASTVLEEIYSINHDGLIAITNYENAKLKNDATAIANAMSQIDDLKAWDLESKVKEILSKLKIENLQQKVKSLSGGQKKRLALAKILIEDADFLVLDEPTNHLDIEMIEWLEQYLSRSALTLFMVTHDRYFLEHVCTHIIELDRGSIFNYTGNYSAFLEKRNARIENEEVVHDKTKKLFKKELDWVRRQPKARGTKAKSRVDNFSKIKEKAQKVLQEDQVQFFIKSSRLGTKILEAQYISHGFDDKVLFKDFYYKFKKGERVGIVGKNGTGKSTLINILTKQLKPNTGKIIVGETVQFGHFNQEGLKTEGHEKVIEIVRNVAEYLPLENNSKLSAEQLLERFLFPRSQQTVKYEQLSGGEKRRLQLLTVLMQNPNFLILDEPTNDLDIMTLNVLEEYLQSFKGCLIIVTHDRYFMDKLVDHIFIIEGDGNIKDFNGNYSEYRNQKLRDQRSTALTSSSRSSKPKVERTQETKRKLSYLEKKEIEKLETNIRTLEKRKKEVSQKFYDTTLDGSQISALSIELGEIEKEIANSEERWLTLSELAD